MKLKRFLLKYDPPGVGLEVENDSGGADVHHKSLPPVEGVKDVQQIASLVEELLNGEPEILNGRRHRAALTQLLVRLYQVPEPTVCSTVEEELVSSRKHEPIIEGVYRADQELVGDGRTSGTGDFHGWRPREGMRAVLQGFRDDLAANNGQVVTVLKVRAQHHKCEVVLTGSRDAQTLKVKGYEHVLPLSTTEVPAIGSRVVIRGLRQHVELNGVLGRVVDSTAEQRCEVHAVESGQLLRVRHHNLVLVDVPPGHPAESIFAREPSIAERAKEKVGASVSGKVPTMPQLKPKGGASEPLIDAVSPVVSGTPQSTSRSHRGRTKGHQDHDGIRPGAFVELCGLTSNANFNGVRAEVINISPDRAQYEIRLPDGTLKKVRCENARLVLPTPKGSNGGSGPTRVEQMSHRARHAGGADEILSQKDPGSFILEPGVIVQLIGLRSAAHLNGQRAVVVRDIGSRAEIRMMDGSAKKVKKQNVEVVGATH